EEGDILLRQRPRLPLLRALGEDLDDVTAHRLAGRDRLVQPAGDRHVGPEAPPHSFCLPLSSRSASRWASRSSIACRLSYSFLPRASASSSFANPFRT